jgi:hypothetical protein
MASDAVRRILADWIPAGTMPWATQRTLARVITADPQVARAALLFAARQLEKTGEAGTASACLLLRQLAESIEE